MNRERGAWAPPSEFDGFRIIGLLGVGAMGRVYLARETLLEREVALKFIAAERPEAHAAERFLIEARAIARLQHPNVVAIYRIGEVDGRPYLAYELVRGTTLAQTPRPIPWRDVLRIGLGLARGLAAAQARGILHRDIKPANVMLTESGEVKLVDFGIAKLLDQTPSATPAAPRAVSAPNEALFDSTAPLPGERSDLALTHAGVVIGTPRYLAPERWTGEPATPRSEVFSLGLVLYELCSGVIGDGARPEERGPLAPVRSLAPEVPPDLAEVIDRSVALDADARWAGPDEVSQALERVARRLSAPPEPTPALPRTRFTQNGDVSLAYQVFGDGPIDLVVVPGFISHLELAWEEPSSRAFLERLGKSARVVLFDKRGTGLSDRVDVSVIGARADDMRAVMDAAGIGRAVIFGQSEGGTLAMVFAALFPERTRGLVLYGASARTLVADDYPMGLDPTLFDWACAEIQARWGGPVFLEQEAPSRVGDEAFAAWWCRYLKMAASPGTAMMLLRANAQIDVRHLLAGLRAPTLVINRRGDALAPHESGRYAAQHIPGARFVSLAGDDHLPFVGDADAVLGAIEAFLPECRGTPVAPRLVAAVLVASLPSDAWAGLAAPAREALRAALLGHMTRSGGAELAAPRPGQLAMVFATPTSASRCAEAMVAEAPALACALHVDVLNADDGSVPAAVIERVAALAERAGPGRVVATRIARDLEIRASSAALVAEDLASAAAPP